ncbi:MAG: ABC-F family ATP-binding cassette domain-containing protein [Gaiellales bacterium]
MLIQLDRVSFSHGAQTVLDAVTLTVDDHSRLGVVGRNGLGKSTLLRLLAGELDPAAGSITRSPAGLAVGYLEQEPERRADETLRGYLHRRTGVAGAERALTETALRLASDPRAADDYDAALTRLLSLGAADLDARASATLTSLGLSTELDAPVASLSGGQAARLTLAAILLARFDVLLLDEPTNDLDFAGLARLERFVESFPGALVVVSHDRAFLDRIATRIAEIDERSRTLRMWAGGWSEFAAARERAREAAYAAYDQSRERRRELTALLTTRRAQAGSLGTGLGEKSGGSDRRGTNALRTKVRQAERLLERTPEAEKPFEPWELHLTLRAGRRAGDRVAALRAVVAERGSFRLGPIDLELAAGDRVAITGPNGSGKSTLLALLLGELALVTGTRELGPATVVGTLAQDRRGDDGAVPLLTAFVAQTGMTAVDARTLLAKFGLGAEHVMRPLGTLSPGERTRARLAELQQREVNLLVLDEPTNHLDLEAIEQLEQALGGYDGALVVVSHDRRFLEAVQPTRELALRVTPVGGLVAAPRVGGPKTGV